MTFRVTIEARNCLLDMEGKVGQYGCFGARFVDAETLDAAVQLVLERVKAELSERVMNDVSDPPTLTVAEVFEVVPETVNMSHGGFTWYPDDEHNA